MNESMKITRNFIRNLPNGPHTFYGVDKKSMAQVHTHCCYLRKFEDKVLTAETFKDGTVKIVVGNDGQGFQNASPDEQGSTGESRKTGGAD